MSSATANYIQPGAGRRRLKTKKGPWGVSLVAFVLALAISVSGALAGSAVAFADDEDPFGPISDMVSSESPDDILKEFNNPTDSPATNTFAYLVQRILKPAYINHTPKASPAGAVQEMANKLNFNSTKKVCSTSINTAGTVIYHNCDIPNFAAELLQNVYKLIDATGAQNAEPLNSAPLIPGFGQSKRLPGDAPVPADYANSSYKYTGPEIFGYANLRLTSYFGEWDHIQVMSKARMLNNFNGIDTFNLASKTIINAITGAFNRVGPMLTEAGEALSKGNLLGAFTAVFTGLFEGAATESVNTLLDTSEANIALSNGWFRKGFSSTMYGAREIQDQEIDAMMRAAVLAYLNASMPEDRTYDEWLYQSDPIVAPLKDPPKEAISKCETVGTNGGDLKEVTSYGSRSNTKPPGVSEADCKAAQTSRNLEMRNSNICYRSGSAAWSSEATYGVGCVVLYKGSYYVKTSGDNATPGENGAPWTYWMNHSNYKRAPVWSIDGTQKAESFNTWFSRVKGELGDFDGNVAKYSMDLTPAACTPANANSTDAVKSKQAHEVWLRDCWTVTWLETTERIEKQRQGEQNSVWLTSLLQGRTLTDWLQTTGKADLFDFSSPWKRFICLNPDGTDVTNGYYGDTLSGGNEGMPILVSVYDKSGNVTPECAAASGQNVFRAPIQNGLFGTGYDYTTPSQSPGKDTRHISNYLGPGASVVYPVVYQPLNFITQIVLSQAAMVTMIANEVMIWTYSPVFEFFGIGDLVVSLIEGFRDGIFFNMALLVITLAALYILWQAGTQRKYREGFVSAFYIVLIFLLGGVLMAYPREVVNLVDRVPANLEKAVMGLVIQNALDDDPLCATDSSVLAGTQNLNALDTVNVFEPSVVGDPLDIFGAGYSSADDPLRSMICLTWKAFVYEPWVYAQWGTSSSNLEADDMLNTNEELVGNAEVQLGGGVTVNNWAVYQLYATTMGSAFEVDNDLTTKSIKSRDFYKIVDMQAGPNNGAGTDSRYLKTWSGVDPLPRLGVAFQSLFGSILGGGIIIIYSLTKVVVSLLAVLMLVLMPFAFLIGLFPSKRSQLRKYFLTLLGLIVQRLALVVVLCVFFLMLLAFIGGASDYNSVFVMIVIFSVIFWILRKKLMKFSFFDGVTSAGDAIDKAQQGGKNALGALPQGVLNASERFGNKLKYGVPGVMVGLVTGKDLKTAWNTSTQAQDAILGRRQRALGLGVLERSVKITNEVDADLKRDARTRYAKARDDLQTRNTPTDQYISELEKYRDDILAYDQLRERGAREEIMPLTDYDGNPILDKNDEPMMRKAMVMEIPDDPEDPSDEIRYDVLMFKPLQPTPPEFVDSEFTIPQVRQLSEYNDLLRKRDKIEAKAEKLRTSLYNNREARVLFTDLPKNAKPEVVQAAVATHLSDTRGYTELERQKMARAIEALYKLDNQIDKIDRELVKMSDNFLRDAAMIDHSNDPQEFMRRVIEDANNSGEARAQERKNTGDDSSEGEG